ERSWPEMAVEDVQSERVCCVLRHPVERLFSTFRMFYVRPVENWLAGRQPWGVWPYHGDRFRRSVIIYARRNADSVINDPIRAWVTWLNSNHFQDLVAQGEGHVSGYAWFYNHVRKNTANCEFHTNLTALMQQLRLPLVHEHVGLWPWPARTLDEFVQAAGVVPHLDADFELWNAHK
ncbi:MAG: hypothetical protein VW580_04115, partial [Flavobacteriaceae bacterium]